MSLERVGPAMTYCGSGWAVVCGMDANTIGMICGVVIGVIGLGISWYYKRKRDQREEAEHQLRMARLGGGDL